MAEYSQLNINNLKEGMKLAQEVENEYGAILATPGTILDRRMIHKLQRLGINRISVFSETKKEIKEKKKIIEKVNTRKKDKDPEEIQYQKNVNKFKRIFHRVNDGDFAVNELTDVIDDMLKINSNRDIVKMLTRIRDVDQYTYTHSINVGMLASMFGTWIKLSELERKELTYAGFLHDLGKANVPQEILNKKGKLTEEEFEEVKKHSIYGYKLIENLDNIPHKVARAVLFHHERNDGSGYPMGLEGDKIPLYARIIGIIDVYTAMTSDRVYKKHQSPFIVLKEFEEKSINKFEISLLNTFIKNISHYYKGEKVKLSNGSTGKIVFINPNHLSYPIVKVNENFIDLYKNDLHIVQLLGGE